MKEYIDKSEVVAEIESKRKYAQHLGDNAINGSMQQFYDGMKQGCVDILSFLDTLEVKEVEEKPSDDLEEEIDKELHENWYGEYINLDQFRESAKHFFELGLKAQKGE